MLITGRSWGVIWTPSRSSWTCKSSPHSVGGPRTRDGPATGPTASCGHAIPPRRHRRHARFGSASRRRTCPAQTDPRDPRRRLNRHRQGRGVCPSCNGRHMAQTAAHLADHVILPVPVRQWVISVPKRLRDMLADQPRAVAARSAGSGLRACSTLRPPPTCWPGRTADFQETRVSGSRSIDRDVPSYFQSLEHLLRYCARPPFALERLESKAPLARHVANRLGETPGPGG